LILTGEGKAVSSKEAFSGNDETTSLPDQVQKSKTCFSEMPHLALKTLMWR